MDATLIATDDDLVDEVMSRPDGPAEFVRSLLDVAPPPPTGREFWLNPDKPTTTVKFDAPPQSANHILAVVPRLGDAHQYRLLWSGGRLRFVDDSEVAGSIRALISLGAGESEVIDWHQAQREPQRLIKRGHREELLPDRPSVARPVSLWQLATISVMGSDERWMEDAARQLGAVWTQHWAGSNQFGHDSGLRRQLTFSRESIVPLVYADTLLRIPAAELDRWTEPI